jgi:hypothetical protein
VPFVWKASLVLLFVCLAAAMVIGIVRLVETPTEILGDGFRDLPAKQQDSQATRR